MPGKSDGELFRGSISFLTKPFAADVKTHRIGHVRTTEKGHAQDQSLSLPVHVHVIDASIQQLTSRAHIKTTISTILGPIYVGNCGLIFDWI